jgi:hypothetical protein
MEKENIVKVSTHKGHEEKQRDYNTDYLVHIWNNTLVHDIQKEIILNLMPIDAIQ